MNEENEAAEGAPTERVRYRARVLPRGDRAFWWHWWTPAWHEGRGPYISIGCGLFALYRGY